MPRTKTTEGYGDAWARPAAGLEFDRTFFKQSTAGLLILLFVATPLQPAFAQETPPAEITPTSTAAEEAAPGSDSIDTSVLDAALDSAPAHGEPSGEASSNPQVPSEESNTPPAEEEKPPEGEEPPMSLMDVPEGAPPVINPTFTYQSIAPTVDKTTGALVETIKLAVPPGRSGLQPDLALVYNSQRLEDGSIGYGWDTNIPYIERINRRGTNNLYTDDYFNSSLSGELASTTVSGQYRARVEEGSFLAYTLSATSTGGQWVVYDKKGTKYTFGTSTATRMDDPGASTKVYRWMLEEVRDTNDNFIRYEYYKDNGQIYPSKIYYTGSGSTDGIFTIEFGRESRPDVVTSYKPAFLSTTNYRINQILAKFNGTWVRKYDLAYTAGSNGARSLLSSVTETGQDEAGSSTASLPATTFGYSSTSVSFTDYSGSTMDKVKGSLTALADTDGNGLLDENISFNSAVTGYNYNWIELNFNDGATSESQTFNPPYYDEIWANNNNGPNGYGPQEKGTRFLDFNGDGLADVLRSYDTSTTTVKRIYWNTSTYYTGGGLQWTQSTSTVSLPLFAYDATPVYTLGLFANLNGDGLTDFEEAHTLGDTNGSYFGTGSSLDAATSNFSPIATLPYITTGFDRDIRLVDLNGDGLDDWVYNNSNTMKVCLNTGFAWDSGCNSGFNLATTTVDSNSFDKGVRFLDVNGDGLLDWVRSYSMPNFSSCSSGICPDEKGDMNVVKLNTGAGWATSTISLPYYIATGRVEGGVFMGEFVYNEMWDWSGDGTADAWKKKNAAGKQDMLSKINYTTGGNTQITYDPSANQLGGDSFPKHNQLPMNVWVVSAIANNDANGNSESLSYAYAGGDFYFANPYDRKFAGFEMITETRGDAITKTYFYQGNVSSTTVGEFSDHWSKMGKPYREDVINTSDGSLYKRGFYYWNALSQASNRFYVSLSSTTEETFDGNASHRDRATTFTYATSTGNVIQKIDWGEVTADTSNGTFTDTGSDLASTTISYAASTTVNMSLPHTETTQDQSLNKVKETRYYYDSLALGSVAKGNQTKQEDWITGSTYASTTKAYNSYGLVTTDTDPRSKSTTHTIDTHNLYVATSTNPLSHTTGFQYDFSSGKVKQITDSNNRVFAFTLDALDRLTEEKQPDITTPATLVTKNSYAYTTSSFPQNILKTSHLTSATSSILYTYFDGLGRKIQERKESEGTDTYAVRDTMYNNLGKLSVETLPYFASSTAWATSSAATGIRTSYAYDPLNRITGIGTVVGTTTNAYDDWKTTTTDARGKYKDFIRDAYGNLTTVVEYESGQQATTTYEYNRRNDLTKITDALANVRNFTYDGLSRRLTAEDLHASGDGTYGTWTYTYDAAGNITSQVDPKSQTVNFTYDDINRMLTEDYTGASGTEAFYGYDFCANGKGRQCSATTTNTVHVINYNPLGLVSTTSRNIASTTFAASHEYDRQGNPTVITNPDNSQVRYLFNDAGLPEIIQYRYSTSTAFSNVVSNLNYAPHEQHSLLAYANNTQTCNTFNSGELYRLSSKRTTAYGYACTSVPYPQFATSSPNVLEHLNLLQDLAYSYDAVGNISTIKEIAPNGLGRSVIYSYDDLHRLSVASTTLASTTPYRHAFVYNALGNIAQKFEGSGDYVGTTNTHSVDLETGSSQYAYVLTDAGIAAGNITIEAWIRLESLPAGIYGIAEQSDGGTKVQNRLYYWNDSGTYKLVFARNKEWVSADSAVYTVTLSTGTWYHVVGAYDGTNLRLYTAQAGGTHTLRATQAASGNGSNTSSDHLCVGCYDSSGGSSFAANYYFDGMIDDVRFWNTARNITEMDNNFEQQVSGSTSNLVAYYRLNNDYTDSTPSAYNLTSSGSPVFTSTVPFSGGVGSGGGSVTAYEFGGVGYANPHAVTAIGSGGSTTTLGYDANGNMTSYGTTTFAYDYKNRITQAAASSTATSTYVYDTTVSRVKQTISSNVTYYPHKTFSLASTTLGTAATATSTVYIYAGDVLVATVDRVGTSTSPKVSSFHGDHLSSASVITDSQGNLARALDYYPFGAPRVSTSSLSVIEYTATSTPTNTDSIDFEHNSDQYAYVLNDTGIQGNNITIEAWFRLESLPGDGGSQGIFGIAEQSDAGTKVQNRLYYYNNGGTYELIFARNKEWVSADIASYTVTLSTGTWYHVVGTYDGTNIRLYTATSTNAHTLRATTASSGNGSNSSSDHLSVGCYDSSGGSGFACNYHFDGLIDDVRVYGAVVSTSTMNTHNQELEGNESDLVAYYKLNQNYSDYTAHGYNMSGVNTPTFSGTVPFIPGTGSTGQGDATTYYYSYSTSTVPSKQYIGQFYDDTPKLSYLNARYYDPVRGQFLSQDPLFQATGDNKRVQQLAGQKAEQLLSDPQNLNSYGYGRNNPLRFSDPSGLDYLEIAFSGIVGPFSGGFGLRVDTKGIEGFYSAGAGFGLGGGFQGKYSTADLAHERSLSVSRNVFGAYVLGPIGSYEGAFNPERPLSVGKNPREEAGLVVGYGAGAYQEYTQSIPLVKFPNFKRPTANQNKDLTRTPAMAPNSAYLGRGSYSSSGTPQSIQGLISSIKAQMQSIQATISNLLK